MINSLEARGAEGLGKVSSKEVPFEKVVHGVRSNPQIVSLVN